MTVGKAMRRAGAAGLAAALVLLAPRSWAQESCHDTAMTQLAMDECADQDFRRADAALNAAYRQAAARLKGDADAQPVRQALVAAQKAWLGFRDAECAFRASGSQGGSIQPMIDSQCRAELTQARTKALQAYLHCPEGDLSCPLPPP